MLNFIKAAPSPTPQSEPPPNSTALFKGLNAFTQLFDTASNVPDVPEGADANQQGENATTQETQDQENKTETNETNNEEQKEENATEANESEEVNNEGKNEENELKEEKEFDENDLVIIKNESEKNSIANIENVRIASESDSAEIRSKPTHDDDADVIIPQKVDKADKNPDQSIEYQTTQISRPSSSKLLSRNSSSTSLKNNSKKDFDLLNSRPQSKLGGAD